MTDYLTVYRVEHRYGCKRRTADGPHLHHGPGSPWRCVAPWYGLNGPPPAEDCPSHDIRADEICGVTAEQAPRWWGEAESDFTNPRSRAQDALTASVAGWRFVEYRVPAEYAHVLTTQVCFLAETAQEVAVHGLLHFDPAEPWHESDWEPDDDALLTEEQKAQAVEFTCGCAFCTNQAEFDLLELELEAA